MRKILTLLFILSLSSCSSEKFNNGLESCSGSVSLPKVFSDKFASVTDTKMLKGALGEVNNGKLCQGAVYKSVSDAEVIIYRSWNSTNPQSKTGHWWALQKPTGKISNYRSEYEICYQWSPLDKLDICKLKPNTKIVIGTGQSATCSEYLTYPVSNKLQLYIDDVAGAVTDCTTLDAQFNWK